jgi:hypothetical protein
MSNDKTFITFDNAFVDVSKEIDTYINGADFEKVTADMSPSQIEQYRCECWNKFQNTLLVPAINRMVSYLPNTKIDTLEPPKKTYPTPDEFFSAKIKTPLSHLEFYATNLYTRVNGKFFSVLNRVLLQLENGKVRINATPYNNDKKIFNVWFYLFLSGLQKLIVPVPKLFHDTDTSKPTVRLYRGMPLEKNISNSLWQKPELWEKKEDALGTFLPDQIEEDHKINYYTSLGFSSYSTEVSVSCIFAISTREPGDKPPNMIVYEPRGGKINLPSLRVVSDQSKEDEYLTFPNQKVMIYSRENGVALSDILKENCSTTIGFPPGILMNWIAMTDATDADLRAGITQIDTQSGGRRKNKNKRGIKRSAKCSGAHQNRYKKTHNGHKKRFK